jgi:hypothetical protein
VRGHRYRIDFVGTPKGVDLTPTPVPPVVDEKGRQWPVTATYSGEIGKILHSVEGTAASYRLAGTELYVRAVVTDLTAPPRRWGKDSVPVRAWTQPVGWR